MKQRILLATFLLFVGILYAQNHAPANKNVGLIIGSVISDANGKAVPFATIQLQLFSDTAKRFTSVADKNGAFEIDKLPFDYFRLFVSASGYAPLTLDSIYIRAERYDFNLGDIRLKLSSSAELQEVIVYAEKPLIENKDGKITYNVGESALSNGSSTAEMLKNMPLVSNDPSGKILLKGKEPKILIDDKPTDLTADQLKDLLESLPGSSIEKIEIMTNPPAQYATEQGGVINIVTKKGKIGFTGKSTISGGTRGEGSFSTNVSYRTAKWSTNNVLGISMSAFTGNSHSERQNIYKDSTNFFNTNSVWRNNNWRPNWRSQWDVELNKRHSLQVTYMANINFFDNETKSQFTNINRFGTAYKVSNRNNGSAGSGYGHNISTSYTYKGKAVGEILRAYAVVNTGKNENDKDYFQQFLNGSYQPTGIDSTQTQFFDSYNSSYQLRISYDKPILRKAFVSTGASYQQGVFHNTLNTRFFSKTDSQYVSNEQLSNDFKFHQDIFTVRFALNVVLPANIKVIGGVQAEQTVLAFTYFKGNTNNTHNQYWNVLPNVTIRKEFDKTFNTSLVYRATIRRPGITELNPNVDYSDPYNIRFGNPDLAASTADNYDFNCSWIKGKYYINTSLGYNKVKDVFYAIRTLVGSGKTQTTYQNIATRQEYEASAWGGYTISKKLRINTSVGYTFNQYSNAEKLLFKYRDGGSFYTSLNYAFMPTNLLTLEGNARYSSFADPQGRSRSNLNMNVGIQRKLFEKRLIIGFNIIDPFAKQQFSTSTFGSNFVLQNFSSTNTRNFRLSVSYQLNKMVQKSLLSNKQKQQALNKVNK